MKPWQAYCFGCLLAVAFGAQAQAQQDSKQAKDLYSKAMADTDQAQQVRDLCKAADLDHKDKTYSDACNSARLALLTSDRKQLQHASDAFAKSDWAKTIMYAKYVTSYDPGLSGQANDLVEKAKAAQVAATKPQQPAQPDPSRALYEKIQAAWKSGDFAGATTAAQGITDATLKSAAQPILDNIARYRKYMEDAKALEQSDPQAAQTQYNMASGLNPTGPGNPAAQAQRLQPIIEAKNKPAVVPPPTAPESKPAIQNAAVNTQPKPGVSIPKPADDSARIDALLSQASRDESENKLQAALAGYNSVLHMQASNQGAQADAARVEQKIGSDPGQLRATLIAAIRNFYDSNFADAKASLNFYTARSNSPNMGAAYFYLGATLLEQSILETPRTKQAAPSVSAAALADFQKARAAGYKPVQQYVSPALLKVWDSTGM